MSVRAFYKSSLCPDLVRGIEPDWLRRHVRRTYIRAVILSTPSWVDKDAIKAIHLLKHSLTAATGIEHVVDHIIPLNHPDVCGLTVPCNLRVITRGQNAAKGGKWNPWQIEMQFTDVPAYDR
jgi:hypothetical protein